MQTDPHDDGFERPGRLPHEIEQGLADASHVDNAARVDDPTDDAAHEHRTPWCDSCYGPFDGWLEQYGGHWDTCPNRVMTPTADAPVTRPDLDVPFPSVEWYAQWLHDVGGISQEAGEVFTAALAAERARADQAAEKAWDEGFGEGVAIGHTGEHWQGGNPYRAAPTAEQGTTS